MDNSIKAYIMSLKFAINNYEINYTDEEFISMITDQYKNIMFDNNGKQVMTVEYLVASIIAFNYRYQRWLEGFYGIGMSEEDINKIDGVEGLIDNYDLEEWSKGYAKYIKDNGYEPSEMDSYKDRLIWCFKYIINNLEEV